MTKAVRVRIVTGLAVGLCAAGLLAGLFVTRGTADLPAIKVRPVVSESQIRLPIDSYAATYSQEVLAGRAITKLADACLARYGAPVSAAFLGHVSVPASELSASAVEWLSLTSAEKYGFNPPPSPAVLAFQDTVWADGGTFGLSPAERRVLYGVAPNGTAATSRPLPAGGCLGQAAAEVSANVGSVPVFSASASAPNEVGAAYFELVWPGLPVQLQQAAIQDAETDPRTLAVSARWHTCMSKARFKYPTPVDAMADPRWAPGTTDQQSRSGARTLEVAVATADARCQQQVNFAGIRLAVLTAYEDRLITAHISELRRYEKQIAKLEANARMILGGHRP